MKEIYVDGTRLILMKIGPNGEDSLLWQAISAMGAVDSSHIRGAMIVRIAGAGVAMIDTRRLTVLFEPVEGATLPGIPVPRETEAQDGVKPHARPEGPVRNNRLTVEIEADLDQESTATVFEEIGRFLRHEDVELAELMDGSYRIPTIHGTAFLRFEQQEEPEC